MVQAFYLTIYSYAVNAGSSGGENPAMLYWKKHISRDFPPPAFLFEKASPLSAAFSSSLSSDLPDSADVFPSQRFRNYQGRNKVKFYATEENVVRVVDPGLFFRESMLKAGAIVPMPDIRDKFPKRSFLPREIVSKLPFSTSKLADLRRIFHAVDDSGTMTKMLTNLLAECERAPSPGETKRCVASIEDMVDFATSVLGPNVTALTTESARGYNGEIKIGKVKGIAGGRVTKAVSCHQSLFPYMLYYCHSVPKVKVYEANILDPKSGSMINHGVAICHLNTSSWSPRHEAFLSLGSGPGLIEVCHWIFEHDLTWARER